MFITLGRIKRTGLIWACPNANKCPQSSASQIKNIEIIFRRINKKEKKNNNNQNWFRKKTSASRIIYSIFFIFFEKIEKKKKNTNFKKARRVGTSLARVQTRANCFQPLWCKYVAIKCRGLFRDPGSVPPSTLMADSHE